MATTKIDLGQVVPEALTFAYAEGSLESNPASILSPAVNGLPFNENVPFTLELADFSTENDFYELASVEYKGKTYQAIRFKKRCCYLYWFKFQVYMPSWTVTDEIEATCTLYKFDKNTTGSEKLTMTISGEQKFTANTTRSELNVGRYYRQIEDTGLIYEEGDKPLYALDCRLDTNGTYDDYKKRSARVWLYILPVALQ